MATEYAAWERRFMEQAVKANNNAAVIQLDAAKELKKRVEERTPVGDPTLWHPPYWPKGYVPGTLKASWRLDNGQARTSGGQFTSVSEIESSHGITLNPIAALVLSNPQPYAERVEYGHWSTQAPAGMMRISMLEWPQILQEAASNHRI